MPSGGGYYTRLGQNGVTMDIKFVHILYNMHAWLWVGSRGIISLLSCTALHALS